MNLILKPIVPGLGLEKLSKEQVMDLTKASGRELIGELAKHNREVFMINELTQKKNLIF